ncbi:MAG: HlyD family efflux transporter periplasmic adaptor subunit [Phycisphaerales bacterium]|nr:MAG: HlyD family efflux transporter periplasmic adaptor subunit [Phycisphaerales bacterium]
MTLAEFDPAKPLLLTGSVTSWKEADVAFEVKGRVEFVVEQGTNLSGRWVENGEVKAEGEVLARVDARTYEIARDSAQAALAVAKEDLATARVELAQVLPANEKAAAAERDRAQAEFVRYDEAYKKNAVAEVDVIRAKADRDAMQAKYEQAKAAIETKRAQIESLVASVKQAEQDLKQAEYDLERCKLYAPFDSEVSAVYIEAGGYARQAAAVAHLIMMNPIKIDLAVSPETAARVREGDIARIRLPGQEELGFGRVYDKATTADTKTRTFRISLMITNERTRLTFPPEDPRSKMARISEYMALFRAPDGLLFVEANRALRKDVEGYYVWADPDRTWNDPPPEDHVLNFRRFRVVMGDRYVNFQGIHLFREVTDTGGMESSQVIAHDLPDDFQGGPAIFDRPDWLLRPGQLVEVLLDAAAPEVGLYVPMDTVIPIDETNGVIFLVEDRRAKRTPVRLLGNVGELFRVEADGVRAGALVITDSVHFLQDGEDVRVAGRRELQE